MDFFTEKAIPGEIHNDPWVGFGHNKTLMFNHAFGKTDYVLHIDADDVIEGEIDFTAEDAGRLSYLCTTRRGSSKYKCQMIYNNQVHWKLSGVAHTTIRCLDPPASPEQRAMGDLCHKPFCLYSRDVGARGNDVDKYKKDALLLRDQFFQTMTEDPDSLNSRSVFYAAQSYMDSRMNSDAITWYSLYLKLKNTWDEEVFESNIRIAQLMISVNKESPSTYSKQTILSYIQTATNMFPDRAEPYHIYGTYCNLQSDHQTAYTYLKEAQSKSFDTARLKYRLFVVQTRYGKFVNDELSVACYWTGRLEEGTALIKEIIDDPDFAHHRTRLQTNLDHFNRKAGELVDAK
jgi:hypothetical protein